VAGEVGPSRAGSARLGAGGRPNDSHKWIAVSGDAELTEEGADAQIDKLAKKYIGQETYPWRTPRETHVRC
jgi:hypothetical protein